MSNKPLTLLDRTGIPRAKHQDLDPDFRAADIVLRDGAVLKCRGFSSMMRDIGMPFYVGSLRWPALEEILRRTDTQITPYVQAAP